MRNLPRHATTLETIWVVVPEDALDAYEAALATTCGTVGFFKDDDTGLWQVEGVKDQGWDEAELAGALALAAVVTGFDAPLHRAVTEADGWLARNLSTFPEQLVGQRFVVRGTHLVNRPMPGRLVLLLDAGVAFGSGEHGSTRGCLRALEQVAHRRPRRILDLGTGSGILAMAAAKLLHRPVLGTDIDPWSVRVTAENARLNGLARLVRGRRADGWRSKALAANGPYDLIFANILARPLCKMAASLALNLAPGGTAILAGLLVSQVAWVLGAHRRHGLYLEATLREGDWATLILRKRAAGHFVRPRAGRQPTQAAARWPSVARVSLAGAISAPNTDGMSPRDRPISASSWSDRLFSSRITAARCGRASNSETQPCTRASRPARSGAAMVAVSSWK